MGARDQALLVARRPLAVVVEVRRDPLQVVEELVALALEERDALLELGQRPLAAACSGPVVSSEAITSASPPRR